MISKGECFFEALAGAAPPCTRLASLAHLFVCFFSEYLFPCTSLCLPRTLAPRTLAHETDLRHVDMFHEGKGVGKIAPVNVVSDPLEDSSVKDAYGVFLRVL